VSELIGLRREDVVMGTGAHIRCDGKGRKQRCTPLGQDTAAVLNCWLKHDLPGEAACVFPSIRGRPLSRDAVEELVARYAQRAQQTCPSLKEKRVSPHVLRHSSAMRLRAHGVDQSTIALWLGHESVETTQMDLHADLRLKEQTLSRVEPLGVKPSRYRPEDGLLRFLESL
jgi:site-specific recombinase XerD